MTFLYNLITSLDSHVFLVSVAEIDQDYADHYRIIKYSGVGGGGLLQPLLIQPIFIIFATIFTYHASKKLNNPNFSQKKK